MSYDNSDLLDMLMELNIEQIETVRKRYEELYQGKGGAYSLMCTYAISLKQAEQRKKDLVSLIERVKNTPPDATNI